MLSIVHSVFLLGKKLDTKRTSETYICEIWNLPRGLEESYGREMVEFGQGGQSISHVAHYFIAG